MDCSAARADTSAHPTAAISFCGWSAARLAEFEKIVDAVKFYEQGWSVPEIAEFEQVTRQMIYHRLRQAKRLLGVRIPKRRAGRPRKD